MDLRSTTDWRASDSGGHDDAPGWRLARWMALAGRPVGGGALGADFVPLGGIPSLGSGRKIAMNDNLEHPLGKRVR